MTSFQRLEKSRDGKAIRGKETDESSFLVRSFHGPLVWWVGVTPAFMSTAGIRRRISLVAKTKASYDAAMAPNC